MPCRSFYIGGEAITASTVIDLCRGTWLLKLGDLVIKAGGPGYITMGDTLQHLTWYESRVLNLLHVHVQNFQD